MATTTGRERFRPIPGSKSGNDFSEARKTNFLRALTRSYSAIRCYTYVGFPQHSQSNDW